jgi:hypothetical protein
MGTGTWRTGSGGASPSGSRSGASGGAAVSQALSRESRAANLDEAVKALAQLCSRRNMGGYLQKMVASPALQISYAELFALDPLLVDQSSWDGVDKRYGVRDGAGCLMAIARAIAKKSEPDEPNETFRGIGGNAIESFLLEAVRHDVSVLVNGDSAAVQKRLDKAVFKTTSGHFFGKVVFEMALKELESALPEKSYVELERAAQLRADYVVHKFESRYKTKAEVPYEKFLEECAKNPDWFVERMREAMK